MAERRRRRWPVVLLAILALALAAALAPVVWVEARCVRPATLADSGYRPLLDPAHRRDEINTYLTYPEWFIVHAYEDYAGVVRVSAESKFEYFSSVGAYWSNLCAISRYASERGKMSVDVKTMLYIIGVSFAAEMVVKGVYERTLGRLTEAVRGKGRTPEDRFALEVADDYARFLQQTPWYAYPFWPTLRRFWSEVPWSGKSAVRTAERRVALTLEYGVKALYAKAIGALAGVAPAATRIRSVVRARSSDIGADPRIQRIESRGDGTIVIETPRYRELTGILHALSSRGAEVVEIAGNDDIFVTVLMPSGAAPLTDERLISVPIQARPGWRRDGLAVKVTSLAQVMRAASTPGARFEHAYDY